MRVVECGGWVGPLRSLPLDGQRTAMDVGAPLWANRPSPDRFGGLEPCLCFDASGVDGGGERGVVELVLVGVELGEVSECLVHGVV